MLGFLLARRRLPLVALAVAGAAVLVVHPTWASAIGADVWNVPKFKADIRASTASMERLDAADEEVLQRVQIKEGIIAELIANRITLAEAMDRFAQLASPHDMELICLTTPGESDQEKLGRNVIRYVPMRVAKRDRDAVMCRLEAELQLILSGSAGR